MNSIYIISSVHVENSGDITRKRTVGWFFDLHESIKIVINNEGDLYEANHYNHCVIEEVQAGLYSSIGRKECQERWFEWKLDRYILVDKPNGLENIHNFCNMG